MRRPWVMSGECLFNLCNPPLATNQLLAVNDNDASELAQNLPQRRMMARKGGATESAMMDLTAAPLIGDGSFNLSVAAGHWIVLSFLGAPADPRVERELAEIFQSSHLFDEDRIVFYGIFSAPPDDPTPYLTRTTSAVSFLDGAIGRAFGAGTMTRTVVLDPMRRAVADIPWDYADGHAATVS